MTTLRFGNRVLKIKYGYEATIKSGIIKELMGMENIGGDAESIEKVLLFVPKLLMVGLQKYHKDEYDMADEEPTIEKIYMLLDEYFDDEESDIMSLFNVLQKELMENGFLFKAKRVAKANKKAQVTASEQEEKTEKN